MDNFTKQLIEEFGQGIVDHVSRNRGKYAIGAGVAGLAGYGVYNGNLGSAINMGVDSAAFGVGTHQNETGYEHLPLSGSAQIAKNLTLAAYNDQIDPQIPLIPDVMYNAGKLYNSQYYGESTTVDEDSDDHTGAIVGTLTAAAGIGAGVAYAKSSDTTKKSIKDKLGKARDSFKSKYHPETIRKEATEKALLKAEADRQARRDRLSKKREDIRSIHKVIDTRVGKEVDSKFKAISDEKAAAEKIEKSIDTKANNKAHLILSAEQNRKVEIDAARKEGVESVKVHNKEINAARKEGTPPKSDSPVSSEVTNNKKIVKRIPRNT